MGKHNGHKNWNHWNVSLWINNDEGLYNLACECVEKARNRTQAARDFLALLPDFSNPGRYAEMDTLKTPDGAPYSVSSIRAAMVGR